MSDKNIDLSCIRTNNDIQALKKKNPEAKNLEQLGSIFNKMDKNGDGIIQEEEGSLYYFSNGSVSAMKYEKKDDGTYDYSKGTKYMEASTDGTIKEYGENITKSVRTQEDGSKFEFGYNKNNELIYKKFTDKDDKEFLLSATNKIIAGIEKDGSIKTFHKTRDSFEGTMIDLGLDPSDKNVRAEFEKANPEAAKRGQFTLVANHPEEMAVTIPKSILEKYEVAFYNNGIKLKPKSEGADKSQPWEEEDPNAALHENIKNFANQLREKWEEVEVQTHPLPDMHKGEIKVVPQEKKVTEQKTEEDNKVSQPQTKQAKTKDVEPKEQEKTSTKTNVKKELLFKKHEKYTLNDEFRTKLKSMRTGTSTVPEYKLDENGNCSFSTVGRISIAMNNDLAFIQRWQKSRQNKDGYYHRGPLKDKNPTVLNINYNQYVEKLSAFAKIYQHLSDKQNLQDNEKLFMQNFEQEILEFINAE